MLVFGVATPLWQLAENLHGADLTAPQRSEQAAEWVRLAEERVQAISRQVDEKMGRGRPEGGRRGRPPNRVGGLSVRRAGKPENVAHG